MSAKPVPALLGALTVLGACAGPYHIASAEPALMSFEQSEPHASPGGQEPHRARRVRNDHGDQDRRRRDGRRAAVYQDEDVRVTTDVRGDPDPRLSFGLGFTVDPETFEFTAQGDFPVGRTVIIGPLLQVGASDDDELLALSFNVKKEIDIRIEAEGESWHIYPSAQFGVGAAYLEKDGRPGDDDDVGPLVNFGLGVRVPVDRHVSIGTGMLFNVMPGKVLDEGFFFSWQVLQMSIDF